MTDPEERAQTAGRVMLGLLFLGLGVWKLAGYGDRLAAAQEAYDTNIWDVVIPVPLFWAMILIEIGGGALLLAGWRLRIVAPALAFYALVTGIMMHVRAFNLVAEIASLAWHVIAAAGLLALAANAGAGRGGGRGERV